MNIVFTGNYTPEYNRTNIILQGLQSIPEITVIESPIQSKKSCNVTELKKILDASDVVFLPSFTHNLVPFIRSMTKKPICFDPLISKYLTKVFDYKQVWRYSPRALKNYLKDTRACNAADFILADTEEHKSYFVKTFKIKPEKIYVLPIGVNLEDFSFETEKKSKDFIVGFYGGFIPLQGVRNILEAARILESKKEISFQLVGNGYEYEEMKKLAQTYNLQNVTFLGWVPYEKLSETIAQWSICLGIFGDTKKADLVIPNKIYHYAAMQKPIITKRTDAIREIFTEDETIILCSSNPQEIASKILYCESHIDAVQVIGNNAASLITKQYNQNTIAEKFIAILQKGIQTI